MPFISGLLLGLSMILPIGPQNMFVLNHGLLGGLRRGLIAALTAGLCDTALIVVGATGVSAALTHLPQLRLVLLLLGVVFLLVLGLGSLRHMPVASVMVPSVTRAQTSVTRQVLTGIGVSWGNPHAVLDTVAVLGGVIAAQPETARLIFAAGTVSASWLFFLMLALAGAAFGARLHGNAQSWIRRFSGIVMLVFAFILLTEAIGVSVRIP